MLKLKKYEVRLKVLLRKILMGFLMNYVGVIEQGLLFREISTPTPRKMMRVMRILRIM